MKIPTIDYSALNTSDENHSILSEQRHGITIFLVLIGALFVIYFCLISSIAIAIKIFLGSLVIPMVITLLLILKEFSHNTKRISDRKLLFATQNNMHLEKNITNIPHQGVVFKAGRDKKIIERFIVTTESSPIEVGNYRYTIGSGRNSETVNTGYIRTTLSRTLPHMLLDARANNRGWASNLPTTLKNNQILSLEGNFDKYFTLYAPKQYERDALYVFTPDVMAALIDHASNYDIEIIDNNLFIYSNVGFALSKETTWQQILSLIATLHPDLHKQTHYYADERVYDRQQDIVMQPGKRLKSGLHIPATLIYPLGIALILFAPILVDFMGATRELSVVITGFLTFVLLAWILGRDILFKK